MFVDTNVLEKDRILEAPQHKITRASLESALELSEPLRISRQLPVGGKQIHDANIVATMLAYGERRLLTYNAADFHRYGDRIELVAR